MRTAYIRFLLCCVLVGVVWTGCRKKKVETIPPDKPYFTYYPLKQGNTYLYQVDTIVWDPFIAQMDTSTWQMEERVDTSFTDEAGDVNYKIARRWRKTDVAAFGFPIIYYTKRTQTQAERVEENIRYVKLVFPVKAGRSWNGNMYNRIDSFNQYDYQYKELHVPFQSGANSFDSTIRVQQANYEDAVQKLQAEERYAAGVGLVYRFHVDTTFLSYSDQKGKNTEGYIYRQTLLSYSIK